MTDPWEAQREALGAFIREQRKRANLSLRQLAELTSLSNPYLSQVERGLHQPSVRVLKALSGALNVSAETLLAQAGLIDAMTAGTNGATDTQEPNVPGTEQAIVADPRLGDDQKAALIAVYRSMLASAPPVTEAPPASASPAAEAPPASASPAAEAPPASAPPVTED
jgi:transcriptional regulator with XRE-family HTH domain